jgi:hypothetical protein
MSRGAFADVTVNIDSVSTLASSAGQWFGRASVKVRSGIVILSYYEASAHASHDGELHIRFSDDYGATWTAEDTKLGGGAVTGFPMNPSTLDAGQDAGEPWLYLAPNGNLILHMWRVSAAGPNGGTYQSVSTDGGETWTESAAVDFTGVTDDSMCFATDDDFVYDGVIYAGARIHEGDAQPSESLLIKSTDNGTTWSKVSTIMANNEGVNSQGAWEVGLEYLGNSTILAALRGTDSANAYQRMSTDMGETWGDLTNVTARVGIALRQRVYTRAHLKGQANWWNDRYLIMVGGVNTISGDSQNRRNCIWTSTDAGSNWSNPKWIDPNLGDGGYGDIFYNPNTGKYVVINYQGSLTEASLKQYTLTLNGV